MKPDDQERRLTTILAADVVGFSRLMNADESGTLSALKTHRRELIEPKSQLYGGQWQPMLEDLQNLYQTILNLEHSEDCEHESWED